jgi:hypothetical protein
MINEFINVHVFDGKLQGIFKPKCEYVTIDKQILFNNFLTKLSNPKAIHIVKTMIQDMSKPDRGENYQNENGLDSTDILADILNREYTDLLSLIEEQLVDVADLGPCPSGKVTRLLQLWQTLSD